LFVRGRCHCHTANALPRCSCCVLAVGCGVLSDNSIKVAKFPFPFFHTFRCSACLTILTLPIPTLKPPLSGLELGGLLGGTLSGVLSDNSIKAAKADPKAGLVGRRVQICMAYTVACIGVLLALKGVPAGRCPGWHGGH
jgi:hypothetical protein